MQYDIGDLVVLENTFTNAAGDPTSPTDTTLTLTLPDGTTPAQNPTEVSAGLFRQNHLAAQVGVHHFDWIGTGLVQSRDGGFFEVRATPEGYFTIPELRALPDVSDTAKYPDVRCHAAREWIESIIERECGTSFIGRRVREIFDGDEVNRQSARIRLRTPYVIRVAGVTQNGVALSAGDLEEIDLDGNTFERRTAGTFGDPIPWPSGRRNLVVDIVAGYSEAPPADLREMALQAARYRLISVDGRSGISERTMAIVNEHGTTQLSTANEKRPTGLPEVDAVIMAWATRVNDRPTSQTLDYDPQRGSLFHGGRR